MSYYTYFTLEMVGEEQAINEAEYDAEVINSGNRNLHELVNNGYVDAKWNNFEEDFAMFARQHPKVLFIVEGDGESSDDKWEHRFKGKVQEQHYMQMSPFVKPELLKDEEKNND